MTAHPHQTDLEDLLHYQDAPDFIGPRLPKEHSAYQAWRQMRHIANAPDRLSVHSPIPKHLVRMFNANDLRNLGFCFKPNTKE